MAHMTRSPAYHRLVGRLNRFPLGAPPSPLLYRILAILFSKRDAERAAVLPLRPFTSRQAAKVWGMNETRARAVLDEMADRTLLLDLVGHTETWYVLPPPMAGFFEFALMRIRDDIDQQALSELLYQYLNQEDEFIRELFCGGETKLGRIFLQERAADSAPDLLILDHDRATEVVSTSSDIGIGLCYCRHKMSHVGKACDAPMEACMVLNDAASSLIRHGALRRVGKKEALHVLRRSADSNLVQIGENVREGVNFICNCCPCCCEALVAARKLGVFQTVQTSPYVPSADADRCKGCGACAKVCPVDAISVEANGKIRIDAEGCLGCGICVKGCPVGALELEERSRRLITPRDTFHRTVLMAIERGTLQHLLFDGEVLGNHRAMAAVVGAILRLSPVKKALVRNQVMSRYLEKLAARLKAEFTLGS